MDSAPSPPITVTSGVAPPSNFSAASEFCGEVELAIPALTEYVSLVRLVVSSAAILHPQLGSERVEDLRIAVSEATTNAIRSHQEIGISAHIQVTCKVAEAQVEVLIRDHGSGFDLAALPQLPEPGSPERLKHESGMGLRLMRLLADESEIHPSDAGTTVRLVFLVPHGRGRAIGR
ncbi:MAG: ATP-binding protein [Acidimicrobiia bacterium]|nr:ATP-binding protein [Acidimicrobiia bacterium]MCY4457020.1 ATP-binding protein [Acidimicrobiaceae bacterium]